MPGLGVLPGTVRALSPGVKRPQMQWNQLVARPGSRQRAPGRDGTGFVGVLRPLLCAGDVRRRPWRRVTTAATSSPRPNGAGCGAHSSTPRSRGSVGLAILANFVAACGDGPTPAVSTALDLYPAIDLHDRGAVRLVQGDFGRVRAYGDPLALARSYVAGGARWIHVVDLDAARTGDPVNRDVVLEIAAAVDVPGAGRRGGAGQRRRRGPPRPRRRARGARHRRPRDARAGGVTGGALSRAGWRWDSITAVGPSWPCGGGSARAGRLSAPRSLAWPRWTSARWW